MDKNERTIIAVKSKINRPAEMVWKLWSTPEDIVKWNNASEDWHTIRADNDLRTGGHFNYRMEAKDGSSGFDFDGIYNKVIFCREIFYTLGDGRKVEIIFSKVDGKTDILESFEAEGTHSIDLQRNGWQAILDNFKNYAESK